MSLDNAVNVFILYGCTLSKERSSMRIVAATTDEEMLHTIIGAQILGGTMDYRGFSNMKGFEQFRAAVPVMFSIAIWTMALWSRRKI